MANIADGASSTIVQPAGKGVGSRIDIGATAEAAKWFFGLMEGLSLERLGISNANDITVPPPVSPLMEARQLADKYDIPFFTQVLTEAMWSLAPMGKYQAVTAFSIGFQLRNPSLCRFSSTHMAGIKIAKGLEFSVAKVLGLEALCSILEAYWKTGAFCDGCREARYCCQSGNNSRWGSTKQQWSALSEHIRLSEE